MSAASFLKKMRDMGLTIDQAVELMEAWEEGSAASMPVYDPREAKRAYDRERMRAKRDGEKVVRQSCDSRNDIGDVTPETKVSPEPPSKTQTPTPPSPPKGGSSPKSIKAIDPESPGPGRPISEVVDEIWTISPPRARQRSSRADIERALRAAVARGGTETRIVAALRAYYASEDATKDDGRFAKGAHVVLRADRWEAFEDAPSAMPLVRPDEDPWPRRMLHWRKAQYWNSEWGPKPGKPGCLVPAHLLQEQAA